MNHIRYIVIVMLVGVVLYQYAQYTDTPGLEEVVESPLAAKQLPPEETETAALPSTLEEESLGLANTTSIIPVKQEEQLSLALPTKKLTVPKDFYALVPYRGFKEIVVADDAPIFYILVHGTFSAAEDDTPQEEQHYWGEKDFTEVVPPNFFGPGTNDQKAPIRFSFGWSGGLSDDARKMGGVTLSKGIRYLKETFPNCRIICLGHSHGGNVINVASQQLEGNINMDYAIQLATPVMTYNDKHERFDNSSGYYPNANGISTLMLFYSEYDFVQSLGAGSQSYKRRYGPITGIDLYNVRLRKYRGEDDLHIRMHDKVIGGKILQLCHMIKKMYRRNKNLIADITPAERRRKFIEELRSVKRDQLLAGTTMEEITNRPLICIKPYDASKSSVSIWLTGKPTDSFWTDWTGKAPEEEKRSKEDAEIFKTIFGFAMDQQLSGITRAAQATYAAGKEAKRNINATLFD